MNKARGAEIFYDCVNAELCPLSKIRVPDQVVGIVAGFIIHRTNSEEDECSGLSGVEKKTGKVYPDQGRHRRLWEV